MSVDAIQLMSVAGIVDDYHQDSCDLCHQDISSGSDRRNHFNLCAKILGESAARDKDPFVAWKEGIALERVLDFSASQSAFERSAQLFFEKASNQPVVSRALFEYSTVMNAFARVQKGRLLKLESKLSDSLSEFSDACSILRATIHFGFLAPYVSGCVSLEVSKELSDDFEGCFQGFKNCIALFEQAKLALSFRDEFHPLSKIFDAFTKYSISNALLLEAKILSASEDSLKETVKKAKQAKEIAAGARELAKSLGLDLNRVDYFPVNDYARVEEGSFITAFPEGENLWLLNVGSEEARVDCIGNQKFHISIPSKSGVSFPMKELPKGRVRVVYNDSSGTEVHDEGLLSLI